MIVPAFSRCYKQISLQPFYIVQILTVGQLFVFGEEAETELEGPGLGEPVVELEREAIAFRFYQVELFGIQDMFRVLGIAVGHYQFEPHVAAIGRFSVDHSGHGANLHCTIPRFAGKDCCAAGVTLKNQSARLPDDPEYPSVPNGF